MLLKCIALLVFHFVVSFSVSLIASDYYYFIRMKSYDEKWLAIFSGPAFFSMEINWIQLNHSIFLPSSVHTTQFVAKIWRT